MKLGFNQRHLSIDALAPTELPSSKVLTGVNGSGKSHLLEGIAAGRFAVEGVDPSHFELMRCLIDEIARVRVE